MNIQANELFKNIYVLNPEISSQQLLSAIKERLCKAEALALVAAEIDFESCSPSVVENYVWAMMDLIRESRWLFEKIRKD